MEAFKIIAYYHTTELQKQIQPLMSYIDFEDPILGAAEYGRSEAESVTSMKQDQELINTVARSDENKINQCKDRRSITLGVNQSIETGTSSRKGGSIKVKSRHNYMSMSASSVSDSSVSEDFKIKNINEGSLHPIDQSDQFECKNCIQYPESDCIICGGKKAVKGNNNLVKFLQYVFDFKLGLKQEYCAKKFKFQKNNVNNFCSEFYNNTETKTMNRMSMGASNQIKKISQSEMYSKLNDVKMIHYNFQCDKCAVLPIVGIRYHCVICQDYDECQCCHEGCSHEHNMQKIDKNGSKVDKLMDILSKSQTINKINPLRPPPSIARSSLSSTVKPYHSAIR